MKQRVVAIVCFIIAISALFSACSRENDGVVLNVGTAVHNGIYNPVYATSQYDKDVCNLIFQGLVNRLETGQFEINHLLVENIELSADEKSYTFTLKEGIKFSDGTSLTAEDIVFTYKTLTDPSATAYKADIVAALSGAAAYRGRESKDFVAVEALDALKVRFNFEKRNRDNLGHCGVKILPKAYYPGWEYGAVNGVMMEKLPAPMGSGPYVLTQVTSGESVRLKLNPAYWAMEDETYKIDTINIKFYQEVEYLAALEGGEVDFIPEINSRDVYLDITKWQTGLGEEANMTFESYENNKYGSIVFNNQGSFIRSANLRRAIAYGFNRDKFVQNTFVNTASVTNLPLPLDSVLYDVLSLGELDSYEYDVEKAMQLLESVNYTWDDSGKMFLSENQVVLKFVATLSHPVVEELMPQFVEDMAVLGITVEVETMPYNQIKALARQKGGDWSMLFMESVWVGDDPNELGDYFATSNIPATNTAWYSNLEVDVLLTNGGYEMDVNKVSSLSNYKEALALMNASVPTLPIYLRKSTAIHKNSLEGLSFSPYYSWSQDISQLKFSEE